MLSLFIVFNIKDFIVRKDKLNKIYKELSNNGNGFQRIIILYSFSGISKT
jgi:hypothetical protein